MLNGIGRLNCDKDEFAQAISDGTDFPGWCGWGRFTSITSSRRNLYQINGFSGNQVRYTPNGTFGEERVVGSNLQLQFQAQVALRYYF